MINGAVGAPVISEEAASIAGEIVSSVVEGALITAGITAAAPLLGTAVVGGGIVEGALAATRTVLNLERAAVVATDAETTVAAATEATTVTRGAHVVDDVATESRSIVQGGEKGTHTLSLKEPGSPSSPTTDLETPHSSQEPVSDRSHDSDTSLHSTSEDHTSSAAKTASVASVKSGEKKIVDSIARDSDSETESELGIYDYDRLVEERELAESRYYHYGRRQKPISTNIEEFVDADAPSFRETIYEPTWHATLPAKKPSTFSFFSKFFSF